MQWENEQDPLISDLCTRFMDRKLYKYVELESLDLEKIKEIREVFQNLGLHPEYDLEIDFPTDLPYDVSRPDEELRGKQILLLDKQDRLLEISEESDIVRSISGMQRGKFYLYFPDNKLQAIWHRLPTEITQIFEGKF
ncbi:hypothetical protein D3C77_504140 [compost metagenome]